MLAYDNIVSNLHEIIDLSAITDDRVGKRSTIDGGVCAYLNIVAYPYAPDLGNLLVALLSQGKAKTILANARAWVNDHPVSDEGVRVLLAPT